MANIEKLLQRARTAPQNLSFSELKTLVQAHGFVHQRTKGSHEIYLNPTTKKFLNLQPDNGKAKAYQVKQFLEALDA